MTIRTAMRTGTALALVFALTACSSDGPRTKTRPFPASQSATSNAAGTRAADANPSGSGAYKYGEDRQTIWDLFKNIDDPNTRLEVNRYIWLASLDILNFMPIQRIDPFSGVIVMGYGTPPGGGTSYRATVHITDPALDARSLKVALNTRSGPADPDTVRAIEDAILSRARQLRIKHAAL